jgi:hypothetical protein
MRYAVPFFNFAVGMVFGLVVAIWITTAFLILNNLEPSGQRLLISGLAFGGSGVLIALSNFRDDRTSQKGIPQNIGLIVGCVVPILYLLLTSNVLITYPPKFTWPSQTIDAIIVIGSMFTGYALTKLVHTRLMRVEIPTVQSQN